MEQIIKSIMVMALLICTSNAMAFGANQCEVEPMEDGKYMQICRFVDMNGDIRQLTFNLQLRMISPEDLTLLEPRQIGIWLGNQHGSMFVTVPPCLEDKGQCHNGGYRVEYVYHSPTATWNAFVVIYPEEYFEFLGDNPEQLDFAVVIDGNWDSRDGDNYHVSYEL